LAIREIQQLKNQFCLSKNDLEKKSGLI
jgi:hypothetical protein